MILKSTDSDKPLSKLSPFALQKGIQGLAGVPKDGNRLRSGQVLIEVDRKSHCRNLLQSNMIVDVPIRISPHKSLNFKKGIIRSRGLRGCSDDEILKSEGAKEQGITAVKRFKIKKQGDLVDTDTFLITFGLPTLPQSIKLAYLRIPVEMHIPNPLRCFVCQRFGHHKFNCRRKLTCARCVTEGHDDTSCEASPSCINCGEAHNAYSKDCPRWKKEKEIQRIKCLRNVSFPEARKIVEVSNPAPLSGQSYAKVAAPIAAPIAVGKTTCSSSTQTNLTWVTGPNPSTVLGPQTSEVQTDESIPINTPNSAKHKPSTSQIRSNILKNVARVTSSSQPNKDVHKNKKDENPPKHTKLDKPKPAKPPKPKITTDRQQKGSQNPLADYNSYNVLEHLGQVQEMDLDEVPSQNKSTCSTRK